MQLSKLVVGGRPEAPLAQVADLLADQDEQLLLSKTVPGGLVSDLWFGGHIWSGKSLTPPPLLKNHPS